MKPVKQVKLIFPNLELLWSFADTLKNRLYEINSNNCLLVCDCSDADIERAQGFFQAKLSDDVKTITG
jgi:hypothetical protein